MKLTGLRLKTTRLFDDLDKWEKARKGLEESNVELRDVPI